MILHMTKIKTNAIEKIYHSLLRTTSLTKQALFFSFSAAMSSMLSIFFSWLLYRHFFNARLKHSKES